MAFLCIILDPYLHVKEKEVSKKPGIFYHSRLFSAPWGIRTHDLLIRSQTLYPAELRALMLFSQTA